MLVRKVDSKRKKYIEENNDIYRKVKKNLKSMFSSLKMINVEIKEEIEKTKSPKLKEKEMNILKEQISSDLLIAKLLSVDELEEYGKNLAKRLQWRDLNLESKLSEEIVVFLVSVAFYQDFSNGGYWEKVFKILKLKMNQKIYLYLTSVIKDTLTLKKLYIATETKQWAYNTMITHAIVPLEGGAFIKFLDFVYSFYTSLNSNIDNLEKVELLSLLKMELEKSKDSHIFLRGTKLAIEVCIDSVSEYCYQILKYIDILDSRKIDISNLALPIKDEIYKWYLDNTNKGYYRVEDSSKNENVEECERKNLVGNIKFKVQSDRVDIITPNITLNLKVTSAYVKIGEQKYHLGLKYSKDETLIASRTISSRAFDFIKIKLYVNDEVIKEWNNKIIFLKENGTSLNVTAKDNIYELDYKRIKILFSDNYSIMSSNTGINNEIYCISKNIMFANLYLEDEIYYLKDNKETIIIKNRLQEEQPQVLFDKSLIIDSITIEGKLVLNKQPKIFIPFIDSDKYKVLINDNYFETTSGINEITEDISGKYQVKIFKGIKNTRDSRVLREIKEYFYFKDLSIVFYNEDGNKEYLYSQKNKKPIGNYNFDSENISEVFYENKKIEKHGNTFDLYIDNGLKKNFTFEMMFNKVRYQASGKMRILEWSLDGENYNSTYNKNIVLEDIKYKKLYVKMEGISEEIEFYFNNKKIINREKNTLNFFMLNEYLYENLNEDISVTIEFKVKGSSEKYKESLFKIRKKTKIKEILVDRERKLLNVEVRGDLRDLILSLEDFKGNKICEKSNLTLSNLISLENIDVDCLSKYLIKLERVDEFSFDLNNEIIYTEELGKLI